MKPAPWDHGYVTVPHTVLLPDGRWRIYYSGALCEEGHAVRSQISDDEGKIWKPEGRLPSQPMEVDGFGNRRTWTGMPNTGVDPCVVYLDDRTRKHRYRMYTRVGDTFTAANSIDGITWVEDQRHIPAPGINADPAVVKLPKPGRVLMYFQRGGEIWCAEGK